ncbi:homocysteine S-methyltransferase family protein [Methylopila sp. Yamaguchi]|uniref:homocysteine S-methyltransferase family protein n=1 Tax=Methylopila sp. Yamaguchi TaxID=1437817 RepID=UPI000CACEE14|nr:homocysteine S-methyltransferase family protein [Methylopila sp. Yamaguchi]GBD47798.1 homocysteine S-methyltransferase [Methylopila sp. Yamaguchi]
MAKYKGALPQLSDKLFLTAGGLETTLIFHQGVELPYFAAFILMDAEDGEARLAEECARFAEIARGSGLGFILDTPTWRANRDWGEKLGYNAAALDVVNRRSIEMLIRLRERFETPASPMVISGTIGPRGDGYRPDDMMSVEEAQAYHSAQIASFAASDADMVAAFTLSYAAEAIGIVRAATEAGMPVAISFTLETDGRLATGMSLRDAVAAIDDATGGAAAYFEINCAHPTHFTQAFETDGAWIQRLRGLRANASKRSHAELDASPDLDAGDPGELGREYRDIRRRYGQFTVLGGCCGTDHRHVEQICLACTADEARAA